MFYFTDLGATVFRLLRVIAFKTQGISNYVSIHILELCYGATVSTDKCKLSLNTLLVLTIQSLYFSRTLTTLTASNTHILLFFSVSTNSKHRLKTIAHQILNYFEKLSHIITSPTLSTQKIIRFDWFYSKKFSVTLVAFYQTQIPENGLFANNSL